MSQEYSLVDMEDWIVSHVPVGREADCQFALESLVRWDKRNVGHHTEKREFSRFEYYARMPMRATLPSAVFDGDLLEESVCFEVWSRNLSASGLSCLTFREMIPCLAVDDTAGILQLDQILGEGSSISLGMTNDAGRTWTVFGGVIRVREVANRILEFGLEFVGKANYVS